MAETQTIFTSRRACADVQAVLDTWNAQAAQANLLYRVSARIVQRSTGGPRMQVYLRLPAGKAQPLVVREQTPAGAAKAIKRLLEANGAQVPFV
jgi:hypothetical protein